MEARQRWEALQAQLAAARAACDRGDRDKALEHIDAALAIDPDFLAALWLRERVLAPPEPAASAIKADREPTSSVEARTPDSSQLVSSEGFSRFEQRARQRRVARCIDVARAAMQGRRPKDAAAALNEVIELAPDLPELSELTADLDRLCRTLPRTPRAPWIAGAAIFVIAVLGSWPHDSASVSFHPTVVAPLIVAPLIPAVTVTISDAIPIVTTGAREQPIEILPHARVLPGTRREQTTVPNALSATLRPLPAARLPVPAAAVTAPVAPPPQLPPVLPRPVQEVPAIKVVVPPPAPAAISVPVVDDEWLVKATLQRYRRAFERLDAQAAQAVYPTVNRTALARAFDSLQSQSLAFDACDMHVRGESATATCLGSARYVPKIGSREPHSEPRVWTFTLSKTGGDWTIENARAER